jgi:serine protease Do
VRSLGSGFIINPDGYLVTNNHVVDGATDIRVKLADGRELGAKIVGRDSKTDLALLKIEATGLPVVPLGDSSALQVAEPVMAIGNPFGLAQTVTTGIVSATGRVIGEGPYDDFIQTDASINPGNSGGPLINARGQAVGINTAIFSQSGGSIGIGFAIPINLAKSVVAALAEHGHVVRGWLGVAVQPLTPELAKALDVVASQGALVSAVTPGSPAMQAGLRPGDVITAYDGRKVGRTEDLPRAVAETPVGREVPLTVLRDGKTVSLMARIARLEEPVERVAATGEMGSGLGVAVQPLTPALARELGLSEIQGLLVRAVEDGSPASTVGLAAGDVIVEVDRQPVQSAADLKQVVDKHRGGPPILLLVHRNGESVFVAVSV